MPRQRTLRSLTRELLDTPFFPLMFIGEGVKQLVQNGAYVEVHLALAVLSTVVWVFSDAISVDWDEDVLGEPTDADDN